MPTFPVTPAKEQVLLTLMRAYNIREEDLDEQFIRGSGPGGQKINKTSSCVLLTHRPTGIQVKCGQTRSQALNRFLARRRLVQEIINRVEGKKSAQLQQREKIRRQKRKRSKRAKEKMLQTKKKQSQKKKLRKPPPSE